MKTSFVKKTVAALAISAASIGAQAVAYQYEGVITTCTGICALFTAVDQAATFAFDATPVGESIAVGSISNVDISLSTPSGGALAFVSGIALSSSLTTDQVDNIIGGQAELEATGATTGIVAQAQIDVASGTWTATTGGQEIAAGTGSFVPIVAVPVPAAAWLFGSALVGLAGFGRKHAVYAI